MESVDLKKKTKMKHMTAFDIRIEEQKMRLSEAKAWKESKKRGGSLQRSQGIGASLAKQKPFKDYVHLAIRDPLDFEYKLKSSRKEKVHSEFVRHLFSKYTVPAILRDRFEYSHYVQVGRRGGFLKSDVDFKLWYICLATGGSLFKEHTKGLLTKRETHEFISAPDSLTPSEGVVYAVSICAGASKNVATFLAKTKLSQVDFDVSFWFDLVRFFSVEGNTPETASKVDDTLDYFVWYLRDGVSPKLFGCGLDLVGLKKRMEEWHAILQEKNQVGMCYWDGAPLDDQKGISSKHGIEWEMVQIRDSEELFNEGCRMDHCVSSYLTDCVAGHTSIWMFKYTVLGSDKVRRLTVEMNDSFEVAQVRGRGNRMAREDEREIVEKWAMDNDLKVSEYAL